MFLTLQKIKNVSNFIILNKAKGIHESVDLPMHMLTNIMVDKYNEKYADLSESEREILKVLIEPNLEKKKIVYENTVKECVTLIDTLISEADDESKDKLSRVKSKLSESVEINEDNFINKIIKLVDLKNNLQI